MKTLKSLFVLAFLFAISFSSFAKDAKKDLLVVVKKGDTCYSLWRQAGVKPNDHLCAKMARQTGIWYIPVTYLKDTWSLKLEPGMVMSYDYTKKAWRLHKK